MVVDGAVSKVSPVPSLNCVCLVSLFEGSEISIHADGSVLYKPNYHLISIVICRKLLMPSMSP